MNNCIAFERTKSYPKIDESAEYQYRVGRVSTYLQESGQCVIDGNIQAQLADGLLVEPTEGDLVAYLRNNNLAFVLQILQQSQSTTHLHSSKPLSIYAPKVKIAAGNELDLVALKSFSLVGKQGVISVAGTLVTCAEHLVQQVNQFMLHAKGMLRLSGRQQVITAEEDVRIDGKRINMG